jgi:4-hydroxybenzoate polyprenyltransferase
MSPVTEIDPIADSAKTHWVNRAPLGIRPYLQLSRLDRPVGYWLLALPGWIGLAFAGLSHGLVWTDVIWAALILIGAVAMRGAACTYNDIIDQDLDAQVERTALRPLPAGTVTNRQAWIWTFVQVGLGFLVWLALPWLAKGIALLSLPLVAAYPFMKRITWFPQVWLGLTFNWAVLVAYAAKTGTVSLPLFILYFGLMFWTVGYDTIYACQDIEDDAMVGIKSTARKFGGRVKLWVKISYSMSLVFVILAISRKVFGVIWFPQGWGVMHGNMNPRWLPLIIVSPLAFHFYWQTKKFNPNDGEVCLRIFKSNKVSALIFCFSLLLMITYNYVEYLDFYTPWRSEPLIIDPLPLTQP